MSEDNRFIDNNDGTITDTLMNLTGCENDSYLDLKKFLTYRQAQKYRDNEEFPKNHCQSHIKNGNFSAVR